ncbi:MAG: HYR domain-containing protein [Chloroflexota bacterium]|nr:HYR domain-containing protein [Chloroflexota bacterium]
MNETSAPTSYITRGQRGFTAFVLAGLLALLLTPLVGADTLLNNVTNTADTFEIIDTDPETGLGTATIAYWLVATTATGDANGCNATGSNPAYLGFASLPAGVTATFPSGSNTMIGCGSSNAVSVTFTAAAGTFAIPMASVTGGKSGSTYDATQTAFTLEVAEEVCGDGVDNDGDDLIDEDCNTAPAVTVTGVEDGGAYEYDAVPTASCDVVDAEDGSFSLDAVLTAISGDYAAYGLGSQTASCEYTDGSGEYASASATYSIVDTTAPALTLPANKTAEATGSSGAAVTFTASAEDTLFGAVDVLCDAASGDVFPLGTTTVSCSAVDPLDNLASGDFTVTVQDTQGPVVEELDDILAEATGPSGAVVSFDDPSAQDAVEGAVDVLCAPASGSTFGFGATTVTCSAEDSLGNEGSSSFTVTIADSTGPVLGLPDDITVEATSANGAAVEFTVSADDAVDGELEVNCNYASGATFPLGTTTVTCSATDSRDNDTTGTFTITVEDTTAPQVTVPADKTVAAVNASGAAVSFADEVSAQDAVDGAVAVDCTPVFGSTFALGTTTVTCEAVDSAGNKGSASFSVTVSDQTAPELELPDNITREATGANGAIITYEASATDNVDESVTVSCLPPSGSTFGLGTTTVNCAAEDAAGNEATGSFTVTVVDTTAPALDLPDDITEEATSANGAVVSFTTSADDIVRGDVDVLCTPASGSTFGLGTTTVACEATDAAGNTASGSFTVTVADTTAPIIAAHGDETAEATSANGALVTYTAPTATDAVDGTLTASCLPASGSQFALGTTTVICNVSDAAGNAATATTFTVTVEDTTAPIIDSHANETAEATGPNGAIVTYTAPNATDAVDGTITAICVPASGSTFALGTTTVACNVSDAAGNAATQTTFTVTVTDTTAPEVVVPANQTVEATGPAGAVVTYTAMATDLVDGSVAVSCLPASGSTFPLGGPYTVACSATDAASNTGSGSFTVTVVDTTAPVVAQPANITVDPTSVNGAVVTYTAPSATDAVSGTITASCLPASGSTFAIGTTTVTCSATDGAGNTGTTSFTVTVNNLTRYGFYAPVDMSGIVNTVKAGSTVPLKFEVFAGSTELTDTAVVKSLRVGVYTGPTTTTTDEIETTVTGGTSLRYDSTAGQFVYNWSTKGLTAGQTYQVTLTLSDGSAISALFKMK